MNFIKFQNCILESADENSVQITGNILPKTSNTFSLGSPNQSWNSLNLGPCTLSATNAGTLDTRFGENGKITADFSMNGYSIATSVVINNCNNIIVGGFDFVNNSRYAFAKYFENGQLDRSFGQNGVVITDLSNDYGIFDNQGFNIGLYSTFKVNAIDNNNNIILSGYVGNSENYDIFVARYLPNGKIDTTFGTNGIVISDFSQNDSSQEYSVVVDICNNIIVVGLVYDSDDNISYYALARYLPTGELDTSFGNEGNVINTFSANNNSVALSVAFDQNNNIVITGIDYNNDGNSYYALARYLPTGQLDTSFGTNGIVVDQYFGMNDSLALSLAIDPSNNIVIAGFANGWYAVARYLPTGVLDTSFGAQGTIVTDFSANNYYSQANSVVVDAESNIIVSGFNVNGNIPSFFNYTLVKYLPNGQLNTSFGENGTILTSFSANNSSSLQIANSVVIDKKNYLIIAGTDWDVSNINYELDVRNINYALAKYRNFPDLVAQFNGTGPSFSITGR